MNLMDMITHDAARLWIAIGILAVVAAVCLWAALRRKPAPLAIMTGMDAVDVADGRVPTLVLYASQTGQAEIVAQQTAASLAAGGHVAKAVSLRAVTAEILGQAARVLCVVSTTGEGDAPDEAMRFEHALMRERLHLPHLQFAVLALGDRKHGHFCAFGHRLDDWLVACNAQALRACLEVDDLDAGALGEWEAFLNGLGAHAGARAGTPMTRWRLKDRQVLNGDSKAQKLVQVDLVPEGGMPGWQAGDLIEIVTPKGHRRDYSIASLPREGHIRLFVRQVDKGDGSVLLTQTLQPGEQIDLRLKTHENFHTPAGQGPLLLIGAGSGLAGLRAHLLDARAAGRPCWLIYGERNPVTDGTLCDELIGWQDDGSLERLDLAFSAVQDGNGRYVQDVMVGRTAELKAWLGNGGGILVCGGLDMGKAVESALRGHLGDEWIEDAIGNGRYRRDLY